MEKNTALEALEASERAVREAENERVKAVSAAIAAGASWTEIGNAVGVSKQTAHARYKHYWKAPAAAAPAPSKKSDAPAPAKAPKKSRDREDALDEQQQRIYSGYVNTAMQVIDWKAEQDEAARNKCPYCEQKGHYNPKTGHWYIYRGCSLTAADRAQHAENETTA